MNRPGDENWVKYKELLKESEQDMRHFGVMHEIKIPLVTVMPE